VGGWSVSTQLGGPPDGSTGIHCDRRLRRRSIDRVWSTSSPSLMRLLADPPRAYGNVESTSW